MNCLEADQDVITTSKQFDSPPSSPGCFAAHQYELEVSPEHPIEITKETQLPPGLARRGNKLKVSPTLRSGSRTPFSVAKNQQVESRTESTASPYIVTETSLPMTKTVYLIRHAESDENRRKECLKSSMQGLGKLKLPKKEDVVASMELMNLVAQLDSDVSPRGQAQVCFMYSILDEQKQVIFKIVFTDERFFIPYAF